MKQTKKVKKAWAVIHNDGSITTQLGYEKGDKTLVKNYWYYYETFLSEKEAERRRKQINRFERNEYQVIPCTITFSPPEKSE